MGVTVRQRDLLVSLAVVGLGLFFLSQTYLIENIGNDPVGPEFVPTVLSWLLIGLGLLSAVARIIMKEPDDATRLTVPLPALLWMGAITGFGLLYFLLFLATGYLLATVIALAVVLVAFGVRSPIQVSLQSVLGGLAYFIIFIRVMKVYDPPGSLIDISTFLIF